MKTSLVLSLLIALVAPAHCWAAPNATARQVAPDEMVIRLGFEISQFEFSRSDGYDRIRSADMAYLPVAGLPELPWHPVRFAVPFGASVERVDVVTVSEEPVAGTYSIAPTQPPAILGGSPKAWVAGEAAIYASGEPYPSRLVSRVSRGLMGDHAIASFYVSPFTWRPATGELRLARELEIRVILRAAGAARPARTTSAADPLREVIESEVINPDDVGSFSGAAQANAPGAPAGLGLAPSPQLEEGDWEYVIITSQALQPYFEPLAAWKTAKGVPGKVVTVEWIQANYAGANVQEQIRNFIGDAYQNWGTNWVLLGGDTAVIPSRQVYAMDCEMGIDGNRIRCDLYYSDLDGTWNANGVAPYGEVADSVDMYPDVMVGRAPAENAAGAEVFVAKVLTYEQNPPEDYALDMLMAGEILWTSPYTDAGIGLDMIDRECVPPRFDPILKLYQSQGTESRASVMAAMTAGKNIILHDGHCNESVMGVGGDYLDHTDADTVSNGARTFILNSIGCWPAAIDRDCIAEHFIENPNGGCVAFIGNSRYGWGSPGNPGFGYSDVIQREFARSLLVDGILNLGLAHADSKAHFVPFARDANVFRWNEYQLNLLGDPEMPVWTDEPRHLAVDAPAVIQAGGSDIAVAVADEDGAPCAGARVCIANDHDVYAVGLTDLAGRVAFGVTTAYLDSLVVTVTAENRIPAERLIGVAPIGCALEWTTASVADGGDGRANPGETFDLEVAVKNSGSEPASGVWGTLRSLDARALVIDSTMYYGAIGADSVVGGTGGFGVTLGPGLTNAEAVRFRLVLVDTTGARWPSSLPLVVASPVIGVVGHAIHDLAGDADWIVEPGETISVALEVANSGLTSGSAEVHLATTDPYLACEDLVPATGTIEPGELGYSHHRVVVNAGCPVPYVGLLEAAVSVTGGASVTDTVYFNVGDLAFSDDCESGVGDWTHGGTGDSWHLSSYRSHSGTTSWYCGNEATHQYGSSVNAGLVSRQLVAGADVRLSFWFWYDFTTYGVDGIYVIVNSGGVADTVDYFGSGGALNIESRWVKWERTLEDVTPGDAMTIRFSFKSDRTDVAEGIYIDDVSLTSTVPGQAGVDPDGEQGEAAVLRVSPNPARGTLSLWLSGNPAKATVGIYDVTGRRVANLVKPAGQEIVAWDLKDAAGARVAPGIYVARIEGHAYTSARKLVILR